MKSARTLYFDAKRRATDRRLVKKMGARWQRRSPRDRLGFLLKYQTRQPSKGQDV
jgi:hypothetical protein